LRGRDSSNCQQTTSPKRGTDMEIQIKQVESIKATRMHLDPEAGGA
jgi:hypothetical protein